MMVMNISCLNHGEDSILSGFSTKTPGDCILVRLTLCFNLSDWRINWGNLSGKERPNWMLHSLEAHNWRRSCVLQLNLSFLLMGTRLFSVSQCLQLNLKTLPSPGTRSADKKKCRSTVVQTERLLLCKQSNISFVTVNFLSKTYLVYQAQICYINNTEGFWHPYHIFYCHMCGVWWHVNLQHRSSINYTFVCGCVNVIYNPKWSSYHLKNLVLKTV